MLVTTNPQHTLWEAILPAQCLGLPAHLQTADELLYDPAFFAPFAAYFHQTLGRPSIPIQTYLRLMYVDATVWYLRLACASRHHSRRQIGPDSRS